MKPLSAGDLRDLAAIRDLDSRDVFVSVFVDPTDARWETRLDARARDVRAALAGEPGLLETFEASFATARKALGGAPPEARGLAAFASAPHAYSAAFWLADGVEPRLVVDASPYLRPLARYVDEREAFALVLLDGQRAAVHVVALGKSELTGSRRLDLIGRHKKGGMSQARYQRHRQGAVDRYLDDIATRLDELLAGGEVARVLVAGPGQSKRHLADRLSPRAREALIAVEDAELDDPRDIGHLLGRLRQRAREHESEQSRLAVDELRGALLSGELAVAGPFEVARAARDGRADLVLVLKDHKAGGSKCEAHTTYFATGGRCPACGGAGTEVDLLNEAVEGALLTDASVEFVDAPNPTLDELGGAGALLRW